MSLYVECSDALYAHDSGEQGRLRAGRPWLQDARCFTRVQVSSLALMRMMTHCVAGGREEVMGMLQGRLGGDTRTLVVTSAFALPVQGTETRVNAQADANEYMVQYVQECERQGVHAEHLIGWYHSHPGYGCWLSGIDVSTQELNQRHQEPWLAIVIDPLRTMASGCVELGAFRTYPEGYTPPGAAETSAEAAPSIPLQKQDDYGVHAHRYYALEVSWFESTADAAWMRRLQRQYWASTLASSSMRLAREYVADQVGDLLVKTESAEVAVRQERFPAAATAASWRDRGDERVSSSLLPPVMSAEPESSMTGGEEEEAEAEWPATSISERMPRAGAVTRTSPRPAQKRNARGRRDAASRRASVTQLHRLAEDAEVATAEHLQATLTEALKEALFYGFAAERARASQNA